MPALLKEQVCLWAEVEGADAKNPDESDGHGSDDDAEVTTVKEREKKENGDGLDERGDGEESSRESREIAPGEDVAPDDEGDQNRAVLAAEEVADPKRGDRNEQVEAGACLSKWGFG